MRIQKARKEHICELCGKKIPKGDKYWREYVEDEDGDVIKDEKQHTNCLLYTGALTLNG